jgi:hypothetical protein
MKHFVLYLVAAMLVFAAISERLAVERRAGRAEEQARVADSALKELRPALLRADSLLRARAATVQATAARLRVDTAWLEPDTVFLPGQTQPMAVLPWPTVTNLRSMEKSCLLLAEACEAYRDTVNLMRPHYEARINIKPVTTCTVPMVVTGVIGSAAGAYAGFRLGRRGR